MKIVKNQSMFGFIDKLVEAAKKSEAGTALVSFKKAQRFEGGDIFILYVAPGIEKFEAVKALVNNMGEEENYNGNMEGVG